jgi:hypothetical protein
MEMPLRMRVPVRRRLVEAHRVREAGLEQIVEARGQPLERVGQPVPLVAVNSGSAHVARLSSSTSNGHTAHHGTSAVKCSFSKTIRPRGL